MEVIKHVLILATQILLNHGYVTPLPKTSTDTETHLGLICNSDGFAQEQHVLTNMCIKFFLMG